MKFLVVSSLASDTGSAVRAKLIASNLDKNKVDVEFIKPYPRSLPFKLDLLLTFPRYFKEIVRSDAEYIMSVKSYPNTAFPMFIKKLLGEKIIFDTDDLAHLYSDGLWSRASKFVQEMFLSYADVHTYHNPKIKNYLIREKNIHPEKIIRLKQGVDMDVFENKSSSRRIKKIKEELGISGTDKILTFVGHFDVACDLEYILQALKTVFKKHKHARLLLIGSGEREAEYAKLSKDLGIYPKIILTGVVPHNKIPYYLKLSDVCLVYYRKRKANYYRASMKLREYLAAGKKVVSNDVGDLSDFEKYTYQSKTGVEGYAKMINKLLSGFNDKRQTRARNYIAKNFSWRKITNDFVRTLKQK